MIASLSGNQIIFNFTGTVDVIANSCSYNSSDNKCRFRNVTDGVTLAVSNNVRSNNGTASAAFSQIVDQIDVVAGKAYTLQYWMSIAGSGGLGSQFASGEMDVHAQLRFQRVK